MKKKLANTKCTVKLRKSEYRDEWSFPAWRRWPAT